MQQRFALSDPAMEVALHDEPLFREFTGLHFKTRLPDEGTILRFRHKLEEHMLAEQILQTVNEMLQAMGLLLKAGAVVDATLSAGPSSTKNACGKRDPEMHQSWKGNQWHFGMDAHVGVDADSGLVHTSKGMAVNVNDVVEVNRLLHGEETDAFGDAGHEGAAKRPDARTDVQRHVGMRIDKRRALDKTRKVDALVEQLDRLKARLRTKVENSSSVVKRHFDHVKVRYHGLKKSAAQVRILFAPSNLSMTHKALLVLDGQVHPS